MTTASQQVGDDGTVRSLVPARVDRLPWTRFHWSVIFGLGISWILDGLEIQIVASNGYADTLHLSSAEVGVVGTVYLVGQVVGSLYFGWLSDRLGRKRLFILTLAIYLVGSGIAGFSFSYWFLLIFRFVAGAGIGGEYAAINSAIDELIPSKYRGRVDIAINGTYWGGAALGAAASLPLYDANLMDQDWSWRIGFWIGPVIGLIIIYLRRHIPESPRWLVTHGRGHEADATIDDIEQRVRSESGELTPVSDSEAIDLKPIEFVPLRVIGRVLFKEYPKRTITGAAMMITQSFLYNAIFFTYALVLQNFYDIPRDTVPYFFFPFAIGNLIGPLVLGPLFDTIGRRKMIFATYVLSGLVLAVSAILFQAGALSAVTQTIFWCVAFFFASAGASSAYLTVSETFPLEIRSQAISYFFSVAQIFGSIAPTVYAAMVGDGSARGPLTVGYFLGAGIMIVGGIVAIIFGTDAERRSLETVSAPITLAHRVVK
ncbi:MFS transporter [Gryllotalpicola ginsengisoli]|uniref:MFS transporter n=1 Tax=Gryllotalpicola ginsengisoli TaxID=444608 RepID=UPI00040B4FA0|nr:MFS transporter [Gryllotalpicola ginsengisoli]